MEGTLKQRILFWVGMSLYVIVCVVLLTLIKVELGKRAERERAEQRAPCHCCGCQKEVG